jgi:hypothetical protein
MSDRIDTWKMGELLSVSAGRTSITGIRQREGISANTPQFAQPTDVCKREIDIHFVRNITISSSILLADAKDIPVVEREFGSVPNISVRSVIS